MSADHTPTPWELIPSTEHHGPYVVADYGGSICDFYAMSNPMSAAVCNGGNSKPIHHMGEQADTNAAFAVRAVNAHDDLVEALRGLRSWVSPCGDDRINADLKAADAALAKASA